MLDFAYAIVGFIVAIGVLTTVHEFGHFWVARMLGVKVLRFSIGFGKPLIMWHDKLGTEYVIAVAPLGGYVKMLDQNEGIVAPNELHRAFNNQPIWARMSIFAAGPIFNIILAIVAYWMVFMIGITSVVPVLGDIPKGSVAAAAGLHSGQEVIAINEHQVATWQDIAVSLISHVGESNYINVTVSDNKTKKDSIHALNLSNWALANSEENILKNLGIEPVDPLAPIVGKVQPEMPAAKAGLQPGDEIVSIDGVPVTSRSAVMRELKTKYDHGVHLVIKRKNERMPILLTPTKKLLEGGEATGFIGIQFADQPWPKDLIRMQRYAPQAALYQALQRTKEYTVLTLQFLRKMVMGQLSLQHLAGPISIAKYAGRTAASGAEQFLGFIALVSISLAVLNMLPIPALDGGQFFFCLIELVRGKPFTNRTMYITEKLGFVILGSFMLLAVYNDVIRIIN